MDFKLGVIFAFTFASVVQSGIAEIEILDSGSEAVLNWWKYDGGKEVFA